VCTFALTPSRPALAMVRSSSDPIVPCGTSRGCSTLRGSGGEPGVDSVSPTSNTNKHRPHRLQDDDGARADLDLPAEVLRPPARRGDARS
jgi:hypothetical protein